MNNKHLLACFAATIITLTVIHPASAQYILKQADTEYDLFNFSKAADLYEQAYRKKAALRTAERLASAYGYMNDYKQTESWYAIASAMPGSNDQNILKYASALQHNAKYTEAKAQFQRYIDRHSKVTERQRNLWLGSCDSALKWMRNPKPIELMNVSALNSSQSDWGAVQKSGQIVFASDRNAHSETTAPNRPFLKFDGAKRPDKDIYGWTGNGYLKLYAQHIGQDSLKVIPISGSSEYHVGPASFTGDGKLIFFTMTRIPERTKRNGKEPATINVEIYSSQNDGQGGWQKPIPFPFNNVAEYSLSDPYISADGQSLYFSSNMPGGKGGADLYVCTKTQSGDWGRPVNLEEINTAGNERTVSFDEHNNMYFASDGYIGMGGLDAFRVITHADKITSIQNLGYPFNSPKDDLAYFPSSAQSPGYLSSNRDGGKGSDDIYSVSMQMASTYLITGRVFEKGTGRILPGAVVTLVGPGGKRLSVESAQDGSFSFEVPLASYTISGEKTDFRSEVKTVTEPSAHEQTVRIDLNLERIKLNQGIRIENIYYDFDKSNIRKDAALELDKLVQIMEENPTIWIELGSHTDSRGGDRYNQQLSQRRAESAVAYIISRGINRNRITAKGYGESEPVNNCKNGVDCSEEQHQLNRRTEFKITKY